MIAAIRQRLGFLASRRTKLLALGASSTLAGLLLAASFQFISDHRWYWNTAPLLCVLVLLGTVFGGFLVGRSLAGARNTCLWVVSIGALLGFVWLATGILAAVLGALGQEVDAAERGARTVGQTFASMKQPMWIVVLQPAQVVKAGQDS